MSKEKQSKPAGKAPVIVVSILLAIALIVNVVCIQMFAAINAFMAANLNSRLPGAHGSATAEQLTPDQAREAALAMAQELAAEGIVLLENRDNALPLEGGSKVNLFGFASISPLYGGTGSGASDTSSNVDLVQGLTNAGLEVNQELVDFYKNSGVKRGDQAGFTGSNFTPAEVSADKYGDSLLANAKAFSDTAVVMFSRIGGEGGDLPMDMEAAGYSQAGGNRSYLELTQDEEDLLELVKGQGFGKVIVLINSSHAMELGFLEDGVDAALWIGGPGSRGMDAVGQVLAGTVNPSGRLPDTYAYDHTTAPAYWNAGDFTYGNLDKRNYVEYVEGIYVGYRFYETRFIDNATGACDEAAYEKAVQYPFGYGLSYTTFEQTLDSLNVNLGEKTVAASVTVKNTGSVAGKDAIQLYVSLPYITGGLEKAAVQLLDFAKTDELAPGESKTYTLTADMQNMTSWDSGADNAVGTKGCYVLDAGDYYFTVGNGAHEAVNNVLAAQGASVDGDSANVKTWNLDSRDGDTFARTKNGTAVENQLADMDVNYWLPGTAAYLSRSDWQGTWPKTYSGLTATAEMLDIMDNDIYVISGDNGDPASVTFGAQNGLTLADLKGVADLDDPRWSQLMDQITLEECMIRTGFGGTSTKAIPSIMSPEAIQNDGPNGIYSYPLGQYASSDGSNGDPCVVAENDPNREYRFGTMTNATVIGQTFNKDLVREYGEIAGNYSLWANLTIYWGCGTNLHRIPYNARNHEYYSEDAVLTAGLGSQFVQGGLKYGCLIAPKHLAFNDTEINRSGVATFMTEQQARENELRGTQAIIENGALAVMTAYNRVGITQDNAHTGLMMNILRKEWGFKGLISEDFIQDANYTVLKEAVMNGVTMSCNTGENTAAAVAEKYGYWTVDAVSRDAQLMAALKQAMTWQNYALANSNALDGLSSNSRLVSVRTWYDNLVTGLQIGFGVLTAACAAMYVMSAKKKD